MLPGHYERSGCGSPKARFCLKGSCILSEEDDFGKSVQASHFIRCVACVIAVCYALSIAAWAASVRTVEVAAKSICDESWLNKTVRWHGRVASYTGSSYAVRIDRGENDCLLPHGGRVHLNLPAGFPSCNGEPTAKGGDDVWFEGAIQETQGDQITIDAHSLDFGIATQLDSWEAFRRNCGTNAVKRNPCLAQGKFQAHYFSKTAQEWQGKVLSVHPSGEVELEMSPSDSTMVDLVVNFASGHVHKYLHPGQLVPFSAEFAQLTDGFEFSTRMDAHPVQAPQGPWSNLDATWEQFRRTCGKRTLELLQRAPDRRNATQREYQRRFNNKKISWVGYVFQDVGINDHTIKVKMSPSESMTYDVLLRLEPAMRHSWRFLREGDPIIFSGEVTMCGALTSSAHEIMVDHVEAQYHRSDEL